MSEKQSAAKGPQLVELIRDRVKELRRVPASELIPHPKNWRVHPAGQEGALTYMLRKLGFAGAELTIELPDGRLMLVDGHDRRKLVRADQVLPCIVLDLSEAEAEELLATYDPIGAMARADDQKFSALAASIQAREPTLTRFFEASNGQMKRVLEALGSKQSVPQLLGAPANPEPEKTEPEIPRAALEKLWPCYQAFARGWLELIERGSLSPDITKETATIAFVRSLHTRCTFPHLYTLPFAMERLDVPSPPARSFLRALRKTATGVLKTPSGRGAPAEDGEERAITPWIWEMMLAPRGTLYDALSRTLGFGNCRLVQDFPPHDARDLIERYSKPGARVLDPCHGWGGRPIGFLLSEAAEYHGFDPSPVAHRAVNEIVSTFLPHCGAEIGRTAKKTTIVRRPFEDGGRELMPEIFDFALTSPPYFNNERYHGELSSWRRYATFDEWVAGFLSPLLTLTLRALKPGAVFVFQVGDQKFPLTEQTKRLLLELPAKLEEETAQFLPNSYAGTDDEHSEKLLVIRRLPGAIELPALRDPGEDAAAAARAILAEDGSFDVQEPPGAPSAAGDAEQPEEPVEPTSASVAPASAERRYPPAPTAGRAARRRP